MVMMDTSRLVGDRGAFFAQASREQAQKFQIKHTGLGRELYLDGRRPAVFDVFYDVSTGQRKSGLSFVPILIHDDVAQIFSAWQTKESQ